MTDRSISVMEESKMRVNLLKRVVTPKISETDGDRMTDDGRTYPSNCINTSKFTGKNFVPWVFVL